MIPCDLCSLDCGKQPFVLATPDRTLQFCCEGCRGIYQMLHEINTEPEQTAQNQTINAERTKP